MLRNTWHILIPLAGVAAALVIWWTFADDLNLTGNKRTIYLAAITGIAIVGAVRVLVGLAQRSPSCRGEATKPNLPPYTPPKTPARRGDDR